MIFFYNKFFLLLLPLSLLPIIFHLLFEKKSKVLEFTYISLIQKIVSQYSPKKKLIDIIVMLLRCLIIMLIILFFANPIAYFNPERKRKGKMSVAIALDTSLSMQQKILNTNKLEMCKHYICDLIKILANYDIKLKLVTFDKSVKVLCNDICGPKTHSLVEKILNISKTYNSTNLASLIEYLTSYGSFDKIIVFTDLSAHILDFQKVNTNIKDNNELNTDILFCFPEYTESNFYIEDVKFHLSENKDMLELVPKISASMANLERINVKLFVNNMMVDSKNVDFSGHSKFNYFLETENIFGYFNLPSDILLADNNFYFTYSLTKEEKKILCFVDEPIYVKGIDSKKFYLENLSHSNFFVKIISPEENHQLVEDNIYDGIISINVKKIEDIEKYLDGVKIFFINDNIDIDSYESYFNGIEFVEVQDNPSGFILELSEDEEFKEFFEKFDYRNIKVYRRYLLNVIDKEKWKVLLKFYDGKPALLKYKDIYLFSFSIDRKDSNYIYKPLFVSFINYVLKSKQSYMNIKNFYYVYDDIVIDNEILNISVIDYEKEKLESFYEKGNNRIKFFVPGIYSVETVKKNRIYLAVNVDPKESIISIVNKNELKKKITSLKRFNSISFINILKRNSKEFILQWCFGKDFSDEILIVVGILLIFETILARLIGKNL